MFWFFQLSRPNSDCLSGQHFIDADIVLPGRGRVGGVGAVVGGLLVQWWSRNWAADRMLSTFWVTGLSLDAGIWLFGIRGVVVGGSLTVPFSLLKFAAALKRRGNRELQGGAGAILHIFKRGEEERAVVDDGAADAAAEIVGRLLRLRRGSEGGGIEGAILQVIEGAPWKSLVPPRDVVVMSPTCANSAVVADRLHLHLCDAVCRGKQVAERRVRSGTNGGYPVERNLRLRRQRCPARQSCSRCRFGCPGWYAKPAAGWCCRPRDS